jgi:hypothetical protein
VGQTAEEVNGGTKNTKITEEHEERKSATANARKDCDTEIPCWSFRRGKHREADNTKRTQPRRLFAGTTGTTTKEPSTREAGEALARAVRSTPTHEAEKRAAFRSFQRSFRCTVADPVTLSSGRDVRASPKENHRSMRLFALCTCAALLIVATERPAPAQDHPFGASIAYPGAIGVIWQPATRLALRPDFRFTYSSTSPEATTGDVAIDNHDWTFGTGISALLYVHADGPFRVYVSPRYAYKHETSEITTSIPLASLLPSVPSFPISLPPGIPSTLTSSVNAHSHDHSVAGLIGGEYRVGERFGIFGELGLEFAHATSTSQPIFDAPLRGSSWSVGTTSAVGVNLYF